MSGISTGEAARFVPPEPPISRRPGTLARVLLFAAALFGFTLAFAVAFPPGALDRLPVLLLATLLALAAASKWDRGLRLFALLFPCVGLLARLTGGSDPSAWPTILFAGLAAGWTFRFIYDFETEPDPSGPDRALRSLLVVWTLATLLALVEARNLWALLHGLSGRAVNGGGLGDAAAIRDSLLAFGALGSGAGFYLLLRRSGEEIRRRALSAGLLGVGIAALAALAQRVALLPPERSAYWRMTGRLSGAAVDPNSLGVMSAIALVLALSFRRGARRRWASVAASLVFASALILSGSRSALVLVAASFVLLPALRSEARSARAAALGLAAAAVLAAGVLIFSGSRGALGGRLIDSLDASRSLVSRASGRPILWKAAAHLFRQHPIAGAGMGVFTWRLPDLLRAQGLRLKLRDNPGSAYFQALAETGLLGLAFTLVFAVALARDAVRRVAGSARGDWGLADGAALASLSFLIALTVGSHWLGSDTSLFFFLAASVGVLPSAAAEGSRARALRRAGLVAYAAAALAAAVATARPEEAFRYSPRIGFYAPEKTPGGEFQWTGRRFAFWLAPRQNLRFALANFSPTGHTVEIAAHDAEHLLYQGRLETGGIVSLSLTGGATVPEAVTFSLSSSFVPRRLGIPGGDRRRLGLRAVFLDR